MAGNIPVVAIGGINGENLRAVLSAGAKNVCMVRHMMESNFLEKRTAETDEVCGINLIYISRQDHSARR